jgi:hypothetical protein
MALYSEFEKYNQQIIGFGKGGLATIFVGSKWKTYW